jgi:hypothetical protein
VKSLIGMWDFRLERLGPHFDDPVYRELSDFGYLGTVTDRSKTVHLLEFKTSGPTIAGFVDGGDVIWV